MVQASLVTAWVMLFLKAATLVAGAILVIWVVWAIRSRRSPRKQNDDRG